jgi:hypothetical protein
MSLRTGYTLEAIDQATGEVIVSIRLDEQVGRGIINGVWPRVDFWPAPGGSSVEIETATEAQAVNALLQDSFIAFNPERHRWMFHVHRI